MFKFSFDETFLQIAMFLQRLNTYYKVSYEDNKSVPLAAKSKQKKSRKNMPKKKISSGTSSK